MVRRTSSFDNFRKYMEKVEKVDNLIRKIDQTSDFISEYMNIVDRRIRGTLQRDRKIGATNRDFKKFFDFGFNSLDDLNDLKELLRNTDYNDAKMKYIKSKVEYIRTNIIDKYTKVVRLINQLFGHGLN